MTDYTPTTEEVRKNYWVGTAFSKDAMRTADKIVEYEAFDRWLAEVKAQERERIIALLEKINLDDRFRDYWFGIYGDDFKEQSGFVTLIALINGEEQ